MGMSELEGGARGVENDREVEWPGDPPKKGKKGKKGKDSKIERTGMGGAAKWIMESGRCRCLVGSAQGQWGFFK